MTERPQTTTVSYPCTYVDGTGYFEGEYSPAAPPAPHTCPVCFGHQTVSKPPWVAGDQMTWTDDGTGPYPCRACEGKGVLWR